MNFLGNIIWVVFGGLLIAFEYFVAGFVMMLTIVGIPFGLQSFKLGLVALWPFGTKIGPRTEGMQGCVNTLLNVLWFFLGGVWIMLTHLAFALLFFATVVGIPFGNQHLKLARVALHPFGRNIISEL
ncbi:YccF domain-containing protein [Porphyromonas macacae]|uniref:Inner membrane protein yccF n=1 Tax=Porphyromonas macacae TaxID=28115 RepID=A0A379DHI3_9PORP|nr:YccF domain-containing protein [Porphyromonas macacae]SUB77612.1 Inner membrane protein yccF [Porphyromonas macacae]